MSDGKLLTYDPTGVFLAETGISPEDLAGVATQLEAARTETMADVQLFHSGGTVPKEKEPLDSAFIDMPNRLLAEYRADRDASELGRILKTAERLRESVDRVVVLGIGGSYMGARALMDACCEPYFNELSRADRGSRPRMYFEGNNVDNDASQGLLRLLGNGKAAKSVDDRWAILVISKSGGTLETAAAFRQFLAKLQCSCGDDADALGDLVVPVTGTSGRLFDLAGAIGCKDIYNVPDGVGGRFSVLSAVGLLPAAVLGLNVVQLLEGAVAMNEHFQQASPGENAVLDYVGVSHLLEEKRGANIRIMSVWSKALEAVGLWYDQLLAESLGKAERGATPLTTVNTRDLHSRAQQHQEGRRDKLITNVIVDNWRCDPLAVGHSELNQDKLNDLADKTLPDLMAAAIQGTNQAYRDDNRPTADIHLPDTKEHAIGQFFQMMMLATVVEGRLMGINPYGQPGVEGYKNNMSRILGR
ncbi:MAG: glucose-6-phosphate isomerase [Planctomycetaceae bacterium]|nr:glucose-6-phosphate isomerase [Planctomycetales bacterium]MCB9927296.1 glucose-6-phosphate isomerase [Planctomycetaceae bacterium]